jgi:hypothetical protein
MKEQITLLTICRKCRQMAAAGLPDYTKPKRGKIYQMTTKYIKCTQIGMFLLENVPSGNPGQQFQAVGQVDVFCLTAFRILLDSLKFRSSGSFFTFSDTFLDV